MGELSKLPNIGAAVEKQLNEVGVYSFDELSEMGSKEAWLRIRHIDESACINRLYALEGAIRGIRWHKLEPEIKEELKDFYNSCTK